MERLTTRCNGQALMAWEHEEKHTTQEWIDILTERLADYEDTGRMPEEIKVILERYRAFRSAISDETGQPMVSWTRVNEICRAEKDGRLVVLPFKPGTEYWGHCHIRNANPISHSYFTLPRIPTLGKDAWLTREEAEAALKDE